MSAPVNAVRSQAAIAEELMATLAGVSRDRSRGVAQRGVRALSGGNRGRGDHRPGADGHRRGLASRAK